MEALLIIIFVIPAILVIALIIAIFWGFRYSENKKKYFSILSIIILATLFFISTAFYDYKSVFVNTFSFNKVPSEYKEYPRLSDTVTSEYTIKHLEGAVSRLFMDSTKHHYILETRNNSYYNNRDFYYKIDSLGQFLDSISFENYTRQVAQYFLGQDGYYDWISTSDRTYKAYTQSTEFFDRKTFTIKYNKADYIEFDSDSTYLLLNNNIWYKGKLKFSNSTTSFKDKKDITNTYMGAVSLYSLNDKKEHINLELEDGDLIFRSYPSTKNNGNFHFEYFGKERYSSGHTHIFSGIGSPTGGSYKYEKWHGTAYCKLKVNNKYIPFAKYMEYNLEDDDKYRMSLSIFLPHYFAILSSSNETYIIRTN